MTSLPERPEFHFTAAKGWINDPYDNLFDATELARARVGDDHFTITLVRDRQSHQETITLAWPPNPNVIEPNELAAVTTTVVAVLAEARAQLRLIRKAERKG